MSTSSAICTTLCVHEDKVAAVRKKMLAPEIFPLVSDLFRVVGDPTRTRILYALSLREMCVCDLCAVMDMTKSAISHQLRLLREKGLVSFRREGRFAYYALSDSHIRNLIEGALEHVYEERKCA